MATFEEAVAVRRGALQREADAEPAVGNVGGEAVSQDLLALIAKEGGHKM